MKSKSPKMGSALPIPWPQKREETLQKYDSFEMTQQYTFRHRSSKRFRQILYQGYAILQTPLQKLESASRAFKIRAGNIGRECRPPPILGSTHCAGPEPIVEATICRVIVPNHRDWLGVLDSSWRLLQFKNPSRHMRMYDTKENSVIIIIDGVGHFVILRLN